MLYERLKKILYFVFPKKSIKKYKKQIRKLFFPFFKGSKHACTICQKNFSRFIMINYQDDKLCPYCGSISRDRRLFLLIQEEIYLNKDRKPVILDFSPSDSIFDKLSKDNRIEYYASDLSGNFNADYHYDLTNVNCEDNKFDFIICFHILEHIVEDKKAISELYRIIKPNGIIFIQTPFKDGDIYEDYTIVSPQERLMHFGQEDHVRVYSVQTLAERLASSGFKLDIKKFKDGNDFNGLRENEIIILASK